jgi:hypothetical protein
MSEKNRRALDRTIRFLYDTVRYRRCYLMAIKFEHRGTVFTADTPEEAATLRAELEREDASDGIVAYRNSIWTPDRAEEVITNVGELQKKFLAVLCDSQDGLPSKTVVERMGIDSEVALAGTISGLSKQLRKVSLKPRDAYAVNIEYEGKGKKRSFILVQDFREALEEQEKGVPDAPATKRDSK